MIRVRKMAAEDIAVVFALEQSCFGVPWSADMLADCLKNPLYELRTAVVQDDHAETICGYLCTMSVAGEAELLRIAVSKAYRRQGAAGLMMDDWFVRMLRQQITAATLEVRVGNQAAIGLYCKYGFVPEGIRKNYYQNPPEDALIMWNHSVLTNNSHAKQNKISL